MYELLPPCTVTVTPESFSNDHARSNTGSAGDFGPERVMTAPGTITKNRASRPSAHSISSASASGSTKLSIGAP